MKTPPLPNEAVPFVVLATAISILIIDYLSGPDIRFTILYVVPVALAAWQLKRSLALVLAVAMPLFRLAFVYAWNARSAGYESATNTIIQWVTLVAIALLISHIDSLKKRVRVLEGILPICSYCKKIRGPDQNWDEIETYISQKSAAQFTHTYCPACMRRHSPDILETDRPSQ